METYIVRIYRRDDAGPQPLVGVVEVVGAEGQQPFRSLEELVAILAPLTAPAAAGARRPRRRAARPGGPPRT